MRVTDLCLVCWLVVACGALGCSDPAGSAVDARATRDGGRRGDGGAWTDGGRAGDDGGSATDGGSPSDGGPTDGGSPSDGGPGDAGGGSDADPPRDAGTADTGTPDAGAPRDLVDPTRCECDRVLTASDSDVDLSALAPGSVVCLRATTAAERGPLTIRNANGTSAAPIVVRNCDGVVHLRSTTSRAPLQIQTSSHVRVTGAGAVGVERGIRLSTTTADMGLFVGRVHHYEVDHLDIGPTQFAGIMAKMDPSSSDCRVFDRRFDPFVMIGVEIRHNYIHDMPDGEGIYLGNSFYGGAPTSNYCGANPDCDLSRCEGRQYPHEVRQVRIHDNIVQRTGWDGIQIGSAVADCQVYDNRIEQFGMLDAGSQNHGMQIGDGSSCRVYRNYIAGGPIAMHVSGIGGTDVVNNVLADFTSYGIYVNPRPTPLATDVVDQGYVGGFRILHNTLVAPANPSMQIIRDVNVPTNPVPTTGNRLSNNLVVSGSPTWSQLTSRYAWAHDHSLHYTTTAAAGISTPDACPGAASPVVDSGANLASIGVVDDHDARPRPMGAGYDVGALECR